MRIADLALLVLWLANAASAAVSSVRLNPPAYSSSRTLFERVSAEESGIDLVQRFPANPTLEMLEDQRSGAGVCIGDYDLDGHPDVYITNYDQGNRLYRNLGKWRFEDVTDKARVSGEGRWCGGATFADVDNDGDLDLYVCVFGAANLLYVNQGDGTFREEAKAFGLDFAGASVMAAFGDYDRDGLLDAYLVTGRLTLERNHRVPSSSREAFKRGAIELTPDGKIRVSPAYREWFAVISKGEGRSELIIAGQADYLFRNSAARKFTNVNEAAGIAGHHIGLAAIWWDYNEDGFPDLYVSNDYKGPDQFYRNNGNGTFAEITINALPAVPWSSMGSDIADLNNDQRLELFATDMSGSSHARRLLNYTEPQKDRWFLLRANPPQYRRNMLFVNTGTDRFLELAYLAGLESTDWTWSPKFGDLDNDGWTDLFIANGMSRDFINREQGNDLAGNSAWIRAPVWREANFAFRNRGDFRFENVGAAWGLDQVSASYGAALGDLDRDGDLDLVVNNFDEPVSVFRNTGTNGHRLLVRLKGAASNSWGIGATVKAETPSGVQTHYLTLARGFMSANEPLVHFGLGPHASVAKLRIAWPSGREQAFENLEADRLYVVTEPNEAPQRTSPPGQPPLFSATQLGPGAGHRESEFDDFARQPLLPYRLSRLGPGVACADVDGDGDDDFYLGGAAGQSGMLFLHQPGGEFRLSPQPAFESDAGCEDMGALFFDADGNGTQDLYAVSGGVEGEPGDSKFRDRLYLNDGQGRFRKADDRLPDFRDSGSCVVAADFDRDGDLDLFVGSRSVPGKYPAFPVNHLLRNEGGRFADVTDTLAAALRKTGMVTSALWSDADGDGWVDLLIAQDWGPVSFLINRHGRLEDQTREAGLDSLRGWWNGIAGGDVNGDGHIDYVVTNLGLNTQYRASTQQPALLLAGEFGIPGQTQLIEATWEGPRAAPVVGRNLLARALPHLLERYPTIPSFGTATVSDLAPPEALRKAARLEATTLESGVLINNGKGRFDFHPLPRLAQAAPSYGVTLVDVDGDGKLDLYLAQNFLSTQPETGRMNGGLSLLLRGTGNGTFAPVWPKESGLIVPGDGKGLAVTDLNQDGWPDFIVGINNGPALAFTNRGSPENRFLTVRLRGRPGNPTAVGSRGTIRFDDSSTQTAEMHAGSGYLSQSTPTLTFGLTGANNAKAIEIVWPDGHKTISPIAPGQRAAEFKQPSTSRLPGD